LIQRKTIYFEKAGQENTESVLRAAKEYAESEGVNDVVVASTSGEVGAAASRILKGLNLIVVTHHTGFSESNAQELQDEYRQEILNNGARILTGTHALSSVERAVRKEFGAIQPLELIAHTLRRFGEGTKVCIEITIMAADAGLINVDKDIIAVAGSSHGVDTALLIKPANASRFFDLKIREIIAKPREF
jgi:hypothetical protein